MARSSAQNPIFAGTVRAVYDASGVSDTDWHDLKSEDFIDTTTGSACPAGLLFQVIMIASNCEENSFLKYRARTGAGDSTANELPFGQVFTDDIGTLETKVLTIAYKKNAAADKTQFIAGFIRNV